MATTAVSSVEDQSVRGGWEVRYEDMGRRERDRDLRQTQQDVAMNRRAGGGERDRLSE